MRVVSLSPSITDILVSIGAGDSLVGITPFCKPWFGRDVREVEFAGDYLRARVDVLERLRPDYVFLQSHVHDKIYADLRSRGFNAILVSLPSTVLEALSNVVLVGSIVGRHHESRELVSKIMDELSEQLAESYSKPIHNRVRVYVEYLWPNWTYDTSGSLTYINDEVWIAGGLNIFYDVTNKFFTPRDEDVLARKPELILVNVEPIIKIGLTDYLRRRNIINELYRHNSRVELLVESREVNLAHWGPTALVPTIKTLTQLVRELSTTTTN